MHQRRNAGDQPAAQKLLALVAVLLALAFQRPGQLANPLLAIPRFRVDPLKDRVEGVHVGDCLDVFGQVLTRQGAARSQAVQMRQPDVLRVVGRAPQARDRNLNLLSHEVVPSCDAEPSHQTSKVADCVQRAQFHAQVGEVGRLHQLHVIDSRRIYALAPHSILGHLLELPCDRRLGRCRRCAGRLASSPRQIQADHLCAQAVLGAKVGHRQRGSLGVRQQVEAFRQRIAQVPAAANAGRRLDELHDRRPARQGTRNFEHAGGADLLGGWH
ncbi:hypothetical protein D3C78_1212390 [compost metagenome]